MPLATQDLIAALREQRVLPVLRGARADVLSTARAALNAGAQVIELTTTVEKWPEVLRELRSEWPAASFGLGTVQTAEDARQAADAGAHFLVSPAAVPAARQVADAEGLVLIEGGQPPTELRGCASAAEGLAKLFPAHVGGVKFLKSVAQIIGEAYIVPTGGISLEEVDEWLAAGAVAVGIGSGFPEDPEAMGRIFGRG